MTRFLKQAIIGGIYLALLLGVVWFGYRAFYPAPTCSDGVKNGAEDGLDCGATACGILCPTAVLPIEIRPTLLLKAGREYDALIHLENPNNLYGASRVDYTLIVRDASGSSLTTRSGFTYVNPAQPRYVLVPLTGITAVPTQAELQIDATTVQWSALSVDAKGDIQFGIRGEQLTTASESLRFEAAVLNKSKFNFDTVDVTVLVYNERGEVTSANATVQRTVTSGEERAFTMQWPFAVPGAFRAQAIVTTNVFANDNFIRVYGSQEPFQGY